jgi:hypothetical protein
MLNKRVYTVSFKANIDRYSTALLPYTQNQYWNAKCGSMIIESTSA